MVAGVRCTRLGTRFELFTSDCVFYYSIILLVKINTKRVRVVSDVYKADLPTLGEGSRIRHNVDQKKKLNLQFLLKSYFSGFYI